MTTTTAPRRYVTIREAAQLLNRSPWEIYKPASAGKLATVRFHRLLLVALDDVTEVFA